MKKLLLSILLISAVVIAVVACSSNPVEEPTDYSKSENWSKCETAGTKSADTFFIIGTMMTEPQGTDDGTVYINDELRIAYDFALALSGSVFSKNTNLYVPYYRQIDLETSVAILNDKGTAGYVDALKNSRAYLDTIAALDYYFENFNKGKPFIIAGHSQGSALIRAILSDYMCQHPDYYKRMVAAYGLGYGFPESYFESNSHVKAVTGETDTGVVVSWNTEAPGATKPNLLVSEENCLCINPLIWTLDSTYASEMDNIGSLLNGEIIEHYGDAQVDLNRRTVITNADLEPEGEDYGFGDKSLHGYDYRLFYKNLEANAANRIAAFK